MSANFRMQSARKIQSAVLLFVVFSLFTFTSCKEKHAPNPRWMSLSKKQIDKWVKKGLTSGKDSIAYLQLKTAYAGPGTVFRTFATGLTKDGVPVPESFTELKFSDDTVKLDDNYMLIGSVLFTFPYNKFFEKGALKKGINTITFVPFVDTTNKYDMLNYTTRSQEGIFALEAQEQAVLCPPCANCIPPFPKGCREITSKDTTGIE